MPRDPEKVVVQMKPVRLTPRAAAALLSIHYETLRDLVNRDVFTVIAEGGRGVGKRYYLLTEEVEIYGSLGADALREHRSRKKTKPNRRG